MKILEIAISARNFFISVITSEVKTLMVVKDKRTSTENNSKTTSLTIFFSIFGL